MKTENDKTEKPRTVLTALNELNEIVSDHFLKDRHKISAWYSVPNPLLGGTTPDQMIACGKAERLLKIMKEFRAGNHA